MNIEKIQNQEIKEILNRYEHYGYMNYTDLKQFREYHKELKATLESKNVTIRNTNLTADSFEMVETEFEEIDYINKYKIYRTTLVSLYEMNATLHGLWSKETSGYSNNAYYDFITLVKQVNAYWQIENPHKAPNKIAYGWKFCMDKGNSYLDKGWKLYLWGCIKNYLIKNGIEFDKDCSLKVRKIVGLVDVYDTTE